MALSLYTAPKDDAELEKRKMLADSVRGVAAHGYAYTPEDLTNISKRATDVGIPANLLSSMYQKFKADFGATTPATPTAPAAVSAISGPKTPGLDRLAAMQSAPMGSLSSLSRPAQSIGTRSGAMRREVRRLTRMGLTGAANQLGLAAATEKLNEPSIMNQGQRSRLASQEMEAAKAAEQEAADQEAQAQYMRDLLKKRKESLAAGILPAVGPTGI